MKTRFGSLVVVFAALTASGCKMCCPSYDYCSPTNPGAANNEWCGKERRGSIFSNYPDAGEQLIDGETVVEESQAPTVPQPVPAAEPSITLPPAPPPQPTTKPMSYSRNASNTSRRGR